MHTKKIVEAIKREINKLSVLLPKNRNFARYMALNKDIAIEKLMKYDIITFDIFDTLITRKLYEPDDLFRLMQYKLKKSKIGDFYSLRKEAEKLAVSRKIDNVNIYDIYKALAEIAHLEEEEVTSIRDLEIQLEVENCIPRKEVKCIFDALILADKKVILLSDMYLTRNLIEKMLAKCGYYGYYDMWVSCDVGCRKGNGEMWDCFFEKYGDRRTIHVGDNEVSDIKNVSKRGKDSFYLMDSRKMFGLTEFSWNGNLSKTAAKIGDSIVLGLIVNKTFCNSPFAFHDAGKKIQVKNLRECGYAIYGPTMLYFFIWFNEQLKENKTDLILFLSREGYYLKKMYDVFNELTENKMFAPLKNCYFYTSRRASSVAEINDMDDIREILKKGYIGKFSLLLKSHFGIELKKDLPDVHIELPKEIEKTSTLLEPYIEEIYHRAKMERENYKEYFYSIDTDYMNKNIAIVDVGYSGTAQYYLSRMIHKKTDGYYFSTSMAEKPKKIGCRMFSCFGQQQAGDVSNDYWAMLEAFLVAPHGQFCCFEKDGERIKPVFNNQKISQQKIEQFEEVYNGVVDFFRDVLNMVDTDRLSTQLFTPELMKSFFGNVYSIKGSVAKKDIGFFTVELLYDGCKKDENILKR
jgi:predicted HAD superfamily hydrolase